LEQRALDKKELASTINVKKEFGSRWITTFTHSICHFAKTGSFLSA
jgi:hypothetical protein